jgi:stage II sporulation protein D
MKKLIFYAGVMLIVVILLPLLIVKGCGPAPAPGKKPPAEPVQPAKYTITVYNTSIKKAEEMDLEEYIKGVVAAEMPADFSIEALKAQAVAARTFAYGRLSGAYASKAGVHDGIDICTDSTHCQAWNDKASAMKKWSILFAARNWSKISKAVEDTRGLIVVYQGTVANTLFHASSAGRTENVEDVWAGSSVPYLRSVPSEGDEASKGYITTVYFKMADMVRKLENAYPDEDFDEDSVKDMEILQYTAGGRVKTVKVGHITLKGTEFRTLFSLRSAAFKLEPASGDRIKITTTGFGHGVGMSQWGADSLAKRGGTFREILLHYYTGVDIISIEDYEQIK